MKSLLNKIASIQMGYTFRSRLDFLDTGLTAVIQMKDLNEDHIVDCSSLVRVDMEGVKEHHLVKPGDIVFRSRGQVTKAALLADNPGLAVVASPLIKIHANTDIVLPAYLAWYINQPPAQAFLASRAKGTAQRMISKQTLANLEVIVPPLERQSAIVELAALSDREHRLLREIAALRNNHISAKLLQAAEGR